MTDGSDACSKSLDDAIVKEQHEEVGGISKTLKPHIGDGDLNLITESVEEAQTGSLFPAAVSQCDKTIKTVESDNLPCNSDTDKLVIDGTKTQKDLSDSNAIDSSGCSYYSADSESSDVILVKSEYSDVEKKSGPTSEIKCSSVIIKSLENTELLKNDNAKIEQRKPRDSEYLCTFDQNQTEVNKGTAFLGQNKVEIKPELTSGVSYALSEVNNSMKKYNSDQENAHSINICKIKFENNIACKEELTVKEKIEIPDKFQNHCNGNNVSNDDNTLEKSQNISSKDVLFFDTGKKVGQFKLQNSSSGSKTDCQKQNNKMPAASKMSQDDYSSFNSDRYSEILDRINELVKPLHEHLFTGKTLCQPVEHSSTQTRATAGTSPKSSKGHRVRPSLEKCMIHSIPKTLFCTFCKEQRCSHCILTEGICRDHKLAEADYIPLQKEKIKLLKSLETASHNFNQLELHMKDVDAELQNIEGMCMLRREEIHQEFTSFMDLLIEGKNSALRLLDEEASSRKQYLEGFLKKHEMLKQSEAELSDKVTNFVQNNKETTHLPIPRLQAECKKFSSKVKTSLLPEQSPVTSLLDNPFSLFLEKTNLNRAVTRDCLTNGDINFKRKTLHLKITDKLVLEDMIDVPCFPTSSHQTYTVELLKCPATKLWQTSVSSLKGLILNCDTTYCLERNEAYLLRVKVCVSTEKSAISYTEKEGIPTHMMILTQDWPMDLTDSAPEKENLITNQKIYSSEEARYGHMNINGCQLPKTVCHNIGNTQQGDK